MKTKDALLAMTGILVLFAGLPINFTIQYFLYKHVEAPQIVWTLWIIQMPILIMGSILNSIANKIKE